MDILHQMPPYSLFGLENPNYKDARIIVLPVPYGSSAAHSAGARSAPHAIIDASRNMELYSIELGRDLRELKTYTFSEMEPDLNSPKEMVARIEKEINAIIEEDKVPVTIGGDHAVAIGPITALGKKYKDFSVIHFGAHADSRDEYLGSRYSHASVMARARDVCGSCISVGVRSIDEEAAKKYGKETIFMKDIWNMKSEAVAERIVKMTKERVYLTIDVGVLDPSEMPATAAPVPEGLHFHELTSILREVLARKQLIGADFCELNPAEANRAPDYTVAKLISLTLGYAFLLPKER